MIGRWAHGPRPTSSCRSFDTGLKQVIRYTFCPRTAPSACVPCPREPAPRLIFVPSWLLSSQLLSRAHAEQSATAGRRPSVAQAGIIILFEFRALATASRRIGGDAAGSRPIGRWMPIVATDLWSAVAIGECVRRGAASAAPTKHLPRAGRRATRRQLLARRRQLSAAAVDGTGDSSGDV